MYLNWKAIHRIDRLLLSRQSFISGDDDHSVSLRWGRGCCQDVILKTGIAKMDMDMSAEASPLWPAPVWLNHPRRAEAAALE
jgi:hypothetical protein